MKKKVLMPFNLEKAKSGAEICTRDGHKARIVCWDRKSKDYPILALVVIKDGEEDCCSYLCDGRYTANRKHSKYDLMLVEYEEGEQHKFEPYGKVLVRNADYEDWRCGIFSHKDNDCVSPFVCIARKYSQCIPYEENKTLLGTNKSPE